MIMFRPWESADELGNVSYTYYDGQDHVIWTMTPMTNWTAYVFDADHNLLVRYDPLWYYRQFFYDTQNNLIARWTSAAIPTTSATMRSSA